MKTKRGSLTFDSKLEADRWDELCLLQRAGRIALLRRQVSYRIEVNGTKICYFRSDFTYMENGRLVIEDVKSEFTRKMPVYRLKKRLMKAVLGIEISEYTRRKKCKRN